MDNKSNNTHGSGKSFSNFLKRESFYVILFITLCIVAAVAAISINSRKVATNKTEKNVVSKAKDTNSEKPDNALLVEGEKEKKNVAKENQKEAGVKVYKSGKKLNDNKKNATVSVSNGMDTKFIKPLDGKVTQGYSEIPVLAQEFSDDNTKTYKTNLGINIQAKIGSSIKAAADGVVEEVGENPKGYGQMVVIDHKNGFKTIYSNLDGKVSIKKGDTVKQGQEIGKLGDTTLRTSKSGDKKELSHLHFSMLQGNGKFKDLDYENKYINPDKFIK